MIQGWPRWLVAVISFLAERWGWLARLINRAAINAVVNKARHRPHIYSTVHDYVSWTSMTDRSWSARHLPPGPARETPTPEQIMPLFERRGGQILSDKSTCLFPSFAQYLTDGFIRTRMPKSTEPDKVRRRNTSNHEIDLCPLYGRTEEQTRALRALDETPGRKGLLKSQMIGDEEFSPFLLDAAGAVKKEFAVLDEPLGLNNIADPARRAAIFAVGGDRVNTAPQVAAMNTLFLREHNRLAKLIDAANPDWDDERVFQTARNVVIVCFIKVVVEDYINHITPAPFKLMADPKVAWNAPWNKPNWITAEFSLLYRWHALIPDDMAWGGTAHPVGATLMNNPLLIEAGLSASLVSLSAQKAGKLGAFNTAAALSHIELASIRQDRDARLASFSDYRHYVDMRRPKSFKRITKNKALRALLQDLYGSPDNLDFFVGLFCEDLEPNSPLPPLILRMVAIDAFSQALTNPLLSEHAFNPGTFSDLGWRTIHDTSSLRDIAARNCALSEDAFIGMTQPSWKYRW